MTSESVRSQLVEALQLDLVGPSNDHAFARELLPDAPSRWYLTGFLVPSDAPLDQRMDETSDEEIDSAGESEAVDDDEPPDRSAARKKLLPSSMGLSVLVSAEVKQLKAIVRWGDYNYEGNRAEPETEVGALDSPTSEDGTERNRDKGTKANRGYRRVPREESVPIDLPESASLIEVPVPNSDGLSLFLTARPISDVALGATHLPKGSRSISVFLVNRRKSVDKHGYRTFAFQTELSLVSATPFIPRPDLRGALEQDKDWDDMLADLQFRDVFEYAVGHGVSATTQQSEDGSCSVVKTTWIPSEEVEWIAPAPIPDMELRMEALSKLEDGDEAIEKLLPLVAHYREWIQQQREEYGSLEGQRGKTTKTLLLEAEHVASRIEKGIRLLADQQVLEAFRIANRTMSVAARRRESIQRQTDAASVEEPRWRPFQLAFILMTLRSIVEPESEERERVDLLFFPTGGGKTEAYLGLAAFTMVLRRLRNPGVTSAGICVLMRYTLRLLTLDQLGRASALICALELEREQNKLLGDWPFEIGLWVGSAATPNRMGRRGDTGAGREYTAYTKTTRFKKNDRNPAPIPLENCPWCGSKFIKDSFRLVPTVDNPIDLRVHCPDHKCEFSGDRSLPILGVDEPIYRRLPAFLIATVDKFAALPWTGETGALLGIVDRYDANGFYGRSSGTQGKPLGASLLPPELIVQDELHLISGPLGTIAGIYETAIDALATREVEGKRIRPKIIASTATVRRAERQIRALFERLMVTVFPPPGPNRRTSFFAETKPASEVPARLYVGVAAQGRSLKVVLLRAALALLSAGQVAYDKAGGKKIKDNPADPYMTLLGYFNSLRELGGSRRIIEDEVRNRLSEYSQRQRLDPADALFTKRNISYDVLELTSRVPTNDVAAAKRRLAAPFREDDRVDVAIATNMISVGLDIIRLGLMVVLGQPKTSAEYIQATSRVGRDPNRPGLVVTLLNIHKPRDRSHYERFETYHTSFYRSVEATSVTPFSPRALDRALAAAVVALSRHSNSTMTPSLGAQQILSTRAALGDVADRFARRAGNHAAFDSREHEDRVKDNVLSRCNSLLDDWVNIADEFQHTNTKLKYQKWEPGSAKQLLYDFLDSELPQLPVVRRRFKANRSMRDVEASVDMKIKNLNEWGDR
ncbi:MAG TPA: DISARM system helicase DrmA [Pyrinomonadaceae bacterium]|nr:DISARM system helicase DrmA [Pyrinomonadaceae bacterium]